MALAIVFAFVAGLITAVSPCVLPVLPIVLGGGIGESRRRPHAIIAGLATCFLVSILFAAWILDRLGLPKDLLRDVSIGLLFLLAVTLAFPQIGLLIERPLARLSRGPSGDLGGGFLLGCALGFVFVPCGGPAIGFVTSSAASSDFGFKTIAVAVAYTVGASLVLLAIALGGQQASSKIRTGIRRFRTVFGVVVAGAALALVFDLDVKVQLWIPDWTGLLQEKTEASKSGRKAFERGTNITDRAPRTLQTSSSLPDYGPAPDFAEAEGWLNSTPLTIGALRGKVVLIDFWTYSCINCLRTLPHVKAWDRAYRRDGLVIVGVHTPEFAFESEPSNVREAVRDLGVRYPVVLDNKYATWTAYGNQYWPAKYLIDRRGHIRYAHFGEGEYEKTEGLIRELLGERDGRAVSQTIPDQTPEGFLTRETYLGWQRLSIDYVGQSVTADRFARYEFDRKLLDGQYAYAGTWRVERERIVAGRDARLRLDFHAQSVHLVLSGRGHVDVLVNGKPRGSLRVMEDKLYTLVELPQRDDALLELRFTPGLAAYAFTFG